MRGRDTTSVPIGDWGGDDGDGGDDLFRLEEIDKMDLLLLGDHVPSLVQCYAWRREAGEAAGAVLGSSSVK